MMTKQYHQAKNILTYNNFFFNKNHQPLPAIDRLFLKEDNLGKLIKEGGAMKKTILTTLLALTFFVTPIALASKAGLLNPGIKPTSPFYFLDILAEEISLFFAFDPGSKVGKKIQYAEERLAEAMSITQEGEEELAEKTLDSYGSLISATATNLSEAVKSDEKDKVLADLTKITTEIHQTVLADVYKKVPEQAKESVQSALNQSN